MRDKLRKRKDVGLYMLELKIGNMYKNGILTSCIKGYASIEPDITEFLNLSHPSKIHEKRLRVPAKLLNTPVLVNSHLLAVYNHYKLDTNSFKLDCGAKRLAIVIIDNPFLFSDNTIYSCSDIKLTDLKNALTNLISECSKRLPCEFDLNGYDGEWLFLGNKYVCFVEDYILKAFCSIEIINDVYKIWLAYTFPKYRSQGCFSTLLNEWIIPHAISTKSVKYISIATDPNENNPMNKILIHLGFNLQEVSYRT